MTCENKVSYYVQRGYGHKEVLVQCGRTDPYGDRALCEKCQNDKAARAEHNRIVQQSKEDNEWLASAGWGEM